MIQETSSRWRNREAGLPAAKGGSSSKTPVGEARLKRAGVSSGAKASERGLNSREAAVADESLDEASGISYSRISRAADQFTKQESRRNEKSRSQSALPSPRGDEFRHKCTGKPVVAAKQNPGEDRAACAAKQQWRNRFGDDPIKSDIRQGWHGDPPNPTLDRRSAR